MVKKLGKKPEYCLSFRIFLMKTIGLFPGITILNSDKSEVCESSSVIILLRNFIKHIKLKNRNFKTKKYQKIELF